jgi:hypothetical protein
MTEVLVVLVRLYLAVALLAAAAVAFVLLWPVAVVAKLVTEIFNEKT